MEYVVDMSDPALMAEKVVILLEGSSTLGDGIYAYVELSLSELIRMRKTCDLANHSTQKTMATWSLPVRVGHPEPCGPSWKRNTI